MNRIDLHVHSNVSDGTLSPSEVAHLAHKIGLSAIALTDHDTFEGVEACQKTASSLGVQVIAGVELSALFEGRELHILGLNIDIHNTHFANTLKDLLIRRSNRNHLMIEKLNQLGINIDYTDLLSSSDSDEVITRAHFARAMFEKGYISTRNEAFEKYIGNDGPAYISKECLDAQECINLIHLAKGKAILAHPMLYKYTTEQVKSVILTLQKYGLDGVEVIYPKHSTEETTFLRNLCKKNNLLISGGSDFHGANKPTINLGNGYGDTFVPYSLLHDLLS